MALNLRNKVPQADNVVVYDTNAQAISRLQSKANGTITQALDLVMIARTAVSALHTQEYQLLIM